MEVFQAVAQGLTKAFPEGNDPFQIITRLAEECGELAKEVNHWENTGIKRQKYGEPSKASLAKEVKNVITCALQIAAYYGAESELEQTVVSSYRDLKAKGFIDQD